MSCVLSLLKYDTHATASSIHNRTFKRSPDLTKASQPSAAFTRAWNHLCERPLLAVMRFLSELQGWESKAVRWGFLWWHSGYRCSGTQHAGHFFCRPTASLTLRQDWMAPAVGSQAQTSTKVWQTFSQIEIARALWQTLAHPHQRTRALTVLLS